MNHPSFVSRLLMCCTGMALIISHVGVVHAFATVPSTSSLHPGATILLPPSLKTTRQDNYRRSSPLDSTLGSKSVTATGSIRKKNALVFKLGALSRVMGQILALSVQPNMWKVHVRKSFKWALLAATATIMASLQRASTTNAASSLMARTIQAALGASLLRCYLLPLVYGLVMVSAWPYLCHGGNLRRMLHEMYILIPWWFSNKLLTDEHETWIPHFLSQLGAEEDTVDLAHKFCRSRQSSMDVTDPYALAHSSGTLALYRHSFGAEATNSPDWPHVVMNCCYGRVLDDYQDLEEDASDGNEHRNFFLALQKKQQQQLENNDIQAMVVQAMRGMQWHEEQIDDPQLRQYAHGATQALRACMLFKNKSFKTEWNKARAEMQSSSHTSLPDFRWPFASLVGSA
ncbi:unknown protein [Seminavis robusta]|uniref:Transmembrane protein n=1 Tax=Seminavis robusta TaxID=568900 RepID=A0A9N8EZ39_9STRA|nr:unknown protein [Seminavis robusta]|eukprot:Sro2269_g321340.1 n/a (401) ;mRNA; r:2887-4089